MDKQIEDIQGTVKELQTTSKFVLKRLQQLLENPEQLDCKCESSTLLQESLQEIDGLKARVSELEKKEKEKEDKLIATVEELKQVQNDLEQLELTVQTDDVKLEQCADTRVQDEPGKHESEEVPARSTQASVEEIVDEHTESHDNGAGGSGETEGAVGGVDITSKETRISAHMKTRPKENDAITKSHPEVIKQTERMSHYGMMQWEIDTQMELTEAKQSGCQNLGGVHTVFVIDISASMVPAWDQVKQFFNEFISGLEDTAIKLSQNEEHVALVTFGHETKVQLRLTNNFAVIRETFGKLKLGGPSPLSGGLLMAIAAVGSSDIQSIGCKDMLQGSKLILITDGEPTEPGVYAGPDLVNPAEVESTRSNIIDTLQKIENWKDTELYVVPVGNANMEFLQFATSVVSGTMLDYKGGRQFSRRLYLMLKTEFASGIPYLTSGEPLSDADLFDLVEIKSKTTERRDVAYNEEERSDLPKVGSRVKRGPDWTYKDQDSSRPGTVIGHSRSDKVCFVNWDANGIIETYKYGHKDKFDILLVDEPRQLKPGETIGIGCVVKPGNHWKPSNTNVTQSDTGIVLKLDLDSDDIPKALVRWDNGTRGNYTYDVENSPEIEIFDTTIHNTYYSVNQEPAPQSSIRRPVKNKNKNI